MKWDFEMRADVVIVRGVFGFNRVHEEKLVEFMTEHMMKPVVAEVF
jgi:hypothetical protein